MVSINKIANFPVVNAQAEVLKNTVKKAAPIAAGGLAVLAGSSMGPVLPPHDVFSAPGSSVTDPLIDQLGYTMHGVMDVGHEILNGVASLGKSAVDGAVALGGTIVHGLSDAGDAIVQGGSDAIDAVTDGITKVAEHIIDALS